MFAWIRRTFFARSAALFVSIGLLLGGVGAASVIYLTPLKWMNFVEPTMHDVDPVAFWEDYQKNPDAYLLLDVRSKREYDIAHAQGSISEPIANLFDDRAVLPKKGKKIVLICSTGRLAGVAYGYLEREGFQNLLRIEGGLNHWADAGLPVVGDAERIPTQD